MDLDQLKSAKDRISLYFEQINQEYQRKELLAMAHLEKQNKGSEEEMKGQIASVGNKRRSIPWYISYLKLMTGMFNCLLWVGAFLCFIVQGLQKDQRDKSNIYVGIVLVSVIVITVSMTYVSESRVAALMPSLKNFIPPRAKVFRDGVKIDINSSELVPGDIIEIKVGEKVPADVVLIQTSEMMVNNASLTGESKDLLRNPEEKLMNIFESPNVAFFGTLCTNGSGIGIVFKTGDNTVIGQIANLAQKADSTKKNSINTQIDKFIEIIARIVVVCFGVLFFCIIFAFELDIVTIFSTMIGIIVANVPESLQVTVIVSMALSAKRMVSRQVLVRDLQSIDTLGSVSCICSDKTGTITQNRMKVSQLYFNQQISEASINNEQNRNKPQLKIGYDVNDPAFQDLLQCMILSSKATFSYNPSIFEIKRYIAKSKGHSQIQDFARYEITQEENQRGLRALQAAEQSLPLEKRNTVGDASETGIIKFAQAIQDLEQTRADFPVFSYELDDQVIDCQIPFNSEIKFNMIIRNMNKYNLKPDNKEQNLCIFMKGAPEKILSRCSKILINGEEKPFADYAEKVEQANASFSKMGERVIAFARYQLDPREYTKNPAYPFDVKNWKKWQGQSKDETSANGWYPMFGLTLVGIVSLNDPTRPRVAQSVEKCRKAGIKVIMITGDQPATAAAIAHKVNIITNPKLEYNYLVQEEELSPDQALEKCNAIVIHGDLLAKKHAEEELMDDTDPEKGRFLQKWISIPEVVFARTSPSQKILIVDACQRLGHIVAVTGDGVNDSPAIKKADIGIAMSSGSDAAKNAADIILLNDDFSNIVMGIEQGRLMFDNLQKSIAYTLSANVPQIFALLCFIVLQVPPPITSILMLAICVGTDIFPAIALAYENAELDIMERPPRNSKRDRLVNLRLMSRAYIQTGLIQAFACMYTYFQIMNDFGYKLNTVVNLNQEQGYEPNPTDIYDPNQPNLGNTNYGFDEHRRVIAWGVQDDTKIDVRLFYSFKSRQAWGRCRWDPNEESFPKFWRISNITKKQYCYTPEAVIYVQSAYFVSVVMTQIANNIIEKTRTQSIAQQQMTSIVQYLGFLFELMLTFTLCYVSQFQIGFGSRAIATPHLVLSLSFCMILIIFDESRKALVRQGKFKEEGLNIVRKHHSQQYDQLNSISQIDIE
eukprot:403343303